VPGHPAHVDWLVGHRLLADWSDLVIIQVTWNDGRTLDQKKVLYKSIVDGLAQAVGIRPEDVFINSIEVRKENWSFGNGIVTYAS
jgi:4-oxalocrotonate tautomerase